MKKKRKNPVRFGCAMLALLFILCSAGAAFADGEPEVQSITFTNAYEDVTGISVVKTVSNPSAVPAEAEDTEFMFFAEFNGSPARGQEYIKYNRAGQRMCLVCFPGEPPEEWPEYYVESMTDEERNSFVFPFETNQDGTFTLRNGERIVFNTLPGGSDVHISEYPAYGFVQDLPAGGKDYYGTVPYEGIEEAKFVNRYIEAPPPPGGKPGRLFVEKIVANPDGYEIADAGSFTYTLLVNGEAWAEKAYSISGESDALTTDADGKFTISGGQTAVFDNIPADTEFTITEAEKYGWRLVAASLEKNGSTMSFDGPEITEATATSGNTRVIYTNSNASFAVKKTLTEDSTYTEKAFSFVLKHEDGTPWTWVEYRIYDGDGKLADDELHNTSESGGFSLKAGQTALFVGIEPGTKYIVSEQADGEYRQVTPMSEVGYTESVKDSVQLLSFVNREAEKKGELSVTKTVNNLTKAAVPDVEFIFRLWKLDGDEAVPMSETPYSISAPGGVISYKTDADGTFRIRAGQTAVFRYVERGVDYRVAEIGAAEYADKFVPQDGNVREGTVTEDGLFFSFVNDYGNFAQFSFYKIAEKLADEETNYLSGAVFTLTGGTAYGGNYIWSTNPEDIKNGVSDEKGLVSFTCLKDGIYKLEETQAPMGYTVNKGYWIINVDEDGNASVSGAVGNPKAFLLNETTGALELPNQEILDLPQSGSFAEAALIVISILLMLSGVTLYLYRKTKYADEL